MSKRTKTIIGISLFAALMLLAVLAYSLLSGKAAPQQSDTAASSGTQRQLAPDFTVQDSNGTMVSFADYKGKPIVINFWASWCPPCKSEMPDYERIYQEYSAKGVVFMMINLTDGQKETTGTARQFLKDNRYTFPAYFDVKYSASDAYGISSIPDSVFIDKDGNIISSYSGVIDSATMRKSIEAILK